MEQNPQQTPEGFASEDEEATYCLSLLRDGDPRQKVVARDRLSQIFERRGLLEEAAQCLESNIREGVRDPRVYQRLAGVYRRQGRHELADEVLLEARRLAERISRSGAAPGRRPGPGRPGRPAPGAGQPLPQPQPQPGPLEAPTANLPAARPSRPPEPMPAAAPTGDFGMDAEPPRPGIQPAGAQSAPMGRPWWLSPAMVAVLVLLLGPFGLAMMWVRGGYAHATRVRIVSIWAVLMVVVLAGAAVTLQTQMKPLMASVAGAAVAPRLPGVGGPSTPIVFGTPPAAGVGAKPTMPPGLAPSPPAIVASPGALPTRPGSTVVSPAPGAEPKPAAPAEKPAAPAEKPAGERVKVGDTGGGGANLRERPGQSAPVIKTVPDGTVLTVVGADQPMDGMTWKNVRDEGGAQGWMAAELLEPAP